MNDLRQELGSRIERLERRNALLVRLGLPLVGLLAAGGLASWLPVCKTVWAERFVLKDSGGRERAVFTAYETGGTPKLTLHDTQGRTLATLSVDAEGGAFLALNDESGERGVRFGPNGADEGPGRRTDRPTPDDESGDDPVTAFGR